MATLRVVKLEYQPLNARYEPIIEKLRDFVYVDKNRGTESFVSSVTNKIKRKMSHTVDSLEQMNSEGCISDVSFVAKPYELTGIVGPDPVELKTIVDVVSGSRRSGIFDGEAYISQGNENDVVFIAADAYTLYLPGLTYYQTVRYNAILRLKNVGDSNAEVHRRVLEALDLMGLTWCMNRVISERPITRGTLGGELRRLRVAADIVNNPSIIMLEEPVRALDFGVAGDMMKRLKTLAEMGRAVICTFSKPDAQTFDVLDSVVVVMQGKTVFNSKRENIIPHFCSPSVGYFFNQESTTVSDFLLDIAMGVERPRDRRDGLSAVELQKFFMISPFSTPTYAPIDSEVSLLPLNRPTPYVDILRKTNIKLIWKRIYNALERAVLTKFSEYAVLQKSISTAVVPSSFMGYFLKGQGNFGDYCMSLFNFPYPEVTNAAAMIFILNSFVFVTQVLNVHIICQKMKVFRFEQKGGVMSGGIFFISTLMAEIPFALFYAFIFSNIMYYMVDYGSGYHNYNYFMTVQMLTASLGVLTTLLLAAVLVKEFAVRDIFLTLFFLAAMISGFPFTFGVVREEILDLAHYNPLRWTFEALMHWKYSSCVDGRTFLSIYYFQNFEEEKIKVIMRNFFFFSGGLLLLALAPRPNFLRRRRADESLNTANASNRFSVDSDSGLSGLSDSLSKDYSDSSIKKSFSPKKSIGSQAPIIFIREAPSGAAQVTLASRPSASINREGENATRGPTITMHTLSYKVIDPRSPLGHKKILNDVTCRFDWGKLCVIMGAKDSGKSTLLHVLSGAGNNAATTISGHVFFDGKVVDPFLKPWQRCAYVEALDEHFRDLTVFEILTYAMELRCLDAYDLLVAKTNVEKTIELMHLVDVKSVSAKLLSRGDRRRLSMAEEFVHGPTLLLIDEPVTNLPARDCALVMNSFRELVNQEKTVIATMHEPSSDVFSLFDTLILMSKGRVIYMGPANLASSFFVDSSLKLISTGYQNPADFLADVSGCLVKNTDNKFVDTPALVGCWKSSARCVEEESKFVKLLEFHHPEPLDTITEGDRETSNATSNPMNKTTSAYSTDRTKSREVLQSVDRTRSGDARLISEDTSQYWRATKSMDISLRKSMNKNEVIRTSSFKSFIEGVGGYLSFERVNIIMTLHRMKIVVFRESKAMLSRPKMIFASFLLQIFIAGLYGIIMKAEDAAVNAGAVTSYFGIGAVLIMLTMLQLSYYLFNNQKVFFKEHSRGLYSMVSFWLVGMIPLLVLRTIHYILYCTISHSFMGLRQGDIGRFYYLNMFAFQIASTILVMVFIYQVTEIRTIYYAIPGLAFFLFFFSGMLVKPSTLPSWCAPWMPSISIIRWYMQAGMINEAYGNEDMFKSSDLFDFYKAYMGLFGWNGKTKYDCFYTMVLNIVVYALLILVALAQAIRLQRGRRVLRVPDDDDRLF